MENVTRGIIYAAVLVFVHNILCFVVGFKMLGMCSFIAFLAIGIYFLKTETIKGMFITGLTALFMLFPFEVMLSTMFDWGDSPSWWNSYTAGFFATVVAVILSTIIIIIKNIEKSGRVVVMEEKLEFTKDVKIKLLVYALITAISFSYLVLPERAGISVVIFTLLQAVLLYFVVDERKKLFWLIPIFILSINSFISVNTIWRVANFVVSMVVYGVMFIDFNLKTSAVRFFFELFERITAPFLKITMPFEWIYEIKSGKGMIIKRFLIATVLSIVSVGALSAVLSSADMVFLHGVENITDSFSKILSFEVVMKIIFGIIVGLYLFGIVCTSFEEYEIEEEEYSIKGDVLIIGTVLLSVLVVYTIFVVIQFKYLFSGANLPYGLNVTEYARKGFFELLALSGVNVAIIILVTNITKHLSGKKLLFIKGVNTYLCTVTVVLLASSFYRMWMYNETDGLTRLRFQVFGFLIFEFIGLLITFFYIAKPRFNIVLVYSAIALFYYLVLNVVPMDAYIAKNQTDRFIKGERDEIWYVLTLSADAAEEIYEVYEITEDENIKDEIIYWFEENNTKLSSKDKIWQRFNLSANRFDKLYKKISVSK